MQGTTQKQWQATAKGLENFDLVNNALIPEPKGHDILIRIIAAGLNPVDWKRCENIFMSPGPVGLDCVGIVEAKGPDVSPTFELGKTLVASHGSLMRQNETGTFAQFTLQDSRYVAVLSETLITKYNNNQKLATDLVALICNGWTAYQIIYTKLKLYPNQVHYPLKKNILVTSGAGGVGTVCLQMINLYRQSLPQEIRDQIKVITTCSERNNEYVKSLGATHCIDYNKVDIATEVKNLTNGIGVDIWVDLVGKDSTETGLQSLAFNGELVVVVENTDYKDRLFLKALSIHNVALVYRIIQIIFEGCVYMTNNHDQILELKRLATEFVRLFEQGIIKPINYREITIEQVKEALVQIKDNKASAKIVLVNN